MKTSTRSVLAVSACLLLGFSTSALAANRVGDVATKTVRFKDLDLSTAVGAQTLYERIAAAARVVCREKTYRLTRACVAYAIDTAVNGVSSPLLTSIHLSTVERTEVVSR